MVPVYVKGGAWSNIEDEILKAAVSKYGLHQWSRVASLLARKTAKQAKARWNEYLDPRLRKSDWSAEEDENLLKLARLMPNQWRSIASKVGRTATQAIERYQKILDDSQGGDSTNDLGLTGPGIETLASVGASKDLQLGDLNINAETKAARPDAVDLDDDEKEMLSEARARLANTQGKKATRKVRERMLEESKRIALLQKRRELKQAGINTKLKAPKKKFENQIDYNADIAFEHRPLGGFYDTTEESNNNESALQNFERKVQTSGVKTDGKKGKKEKRARDEKSGGQTTIEKPAELVDIKRRKLELSAPTGQTPDGTPDVQDSTHDSRISDAVSKIRQLQSTQSALLITEEKAEEQEGETVDNKISDVTKVISTSKEVSPSISLRARFASLPKPKNDFEIMDVDEEDEVMQDEGDEGDDAKPSEPQIAIDQGEIERLNEIEARKERQRALLRRSQAVQKGLPIPKIDSATSLEPLDGINKEVLRLIDVELVKLIRSDYSKQHKEAGVALVGDLDDDLRAMVDKEIKDHLATQKHTAEDVAALYKEASSTDKDDIDDVSLITELQHLMSKTQKIESKLELQFGGYVKRSEALTEETIRLLGELKDADRALAAFELLHSSETIAIKSRTDTLQEEVEKLVQGEQIGQERYLEVRNKRESNGV